MFGGKRRKAVKVALQHARPVLSGYNASRELSDRLPKNFWEVDYVVGYILAIMNGAFDSVGVTDASEKGKAVYQFLGILSLNEMSDDQIRQAVFSTSDESIEGQHDAMLDMADMLKKEEEPVLRFYNKLMEMTD